MASTERTLRYVSMWFKDHVIAKMTPDEFEGLSEAIRNAYNDGIKDGISVTKHRTWKEVLQEDGKDG